MAGFGAGAEKFLFGAGGRTAGANSASRGANRLAARARGRWGAMQKTFQNAGAIGVLGSVREPMLGSMLKGAMIGAGANASMTMTGNMSGGGPMMGGVMQSAFSGGLMGAAGGAAWGAGSVFLGKPTGKLNPIAGGGGGGGAGRMGMRQRMSSMGGRARGWANRNMPTFMGAGRSMRSAGGGVGGGANIAANNQTNVMMAAAGLGGPVGPSRMAPSLLNARSRRGWSDVGAQAQGLMGTTRRGEAMARASAAAAGTRASGPGIPMGGRVPDSMVTPLPASMTGNSATLASARNFLGF